MRFSGGRPAGSRAGPAGRVTGPIQTSNSCLLPTPATCVPLCRVPLLAIDSTCHGRRAYHNRKQCGSAAGCCLGFSPPWVVSDSEGWSTLRCANTAWRCGKLGWNGWPVHTPSSGTRTAAEHAEFGQTQAGPPPPHRPQSNALAQAGARRHEVDGEHSSALIDVNPNRPADKSTRFPTVP